MLMPLRPVAVVPAWLCRTLAACLILGAAAARIAYLVCNCPLDLAPDEAHYWDWSRHLAWSYYSKGPLVALLIRGSCELFGPLSERLTGSLMPAIRLPAVLCGALLLTALYVLTVRVYRRETLALALVALALTVPLLSVGATVMTIDAPYTCCWGWALVAGHWALFGANRDGEHDPARGGPLTAWVLTGLLVGVGILAKYTMVLWVPSVFLFLLCTPTYRPQLRRPGFWVMGVVAGLCCLPILIWNVQTDWATFRHVRALSGGEDTRIYWLGPLIYLAGQCGLLMVVWFGVWVAAMIAHNPLREDDPYLSYLWWLSAPMFLVFFAFGFRTNGGEVNWAVTAYLSGLVLGAGWLVRQLRSPRPWYRRWTIANLVLVMVLGLFMTLLMHHSEWFYPLLSELVGRPTDRQPYPLRRVDPSCRLRGWRTLAREVEKLRAELRARGIEPVLASTTWSMTGELGVYCPDHPPVYCLGAIQGERHSQYDFWPGPVHSPQEFKGRTFVILGGIKPQVRGAFEKIELERIISHHEGEFPVSAWVVCVCSGFRGEFSAAEPRDRHH